MAYSYEPCMTPNVNSVINWQSLEPMVYEADFSTPLRDDSGRHSGNAEHATSVMAITQRGTQRLEGDEWRARRHIWHDSNTIRR